MVTHRPLGLFMRTVTAARLISQAKLITQHLHGALTTTPPLVHRCLAGIGLLTRTTCYKPHPLPLPSSVAPPIFSPPSSLQPEKPSSSKTSSLLYFSLLHVHVRRSDNTVGFTLFPPIFPSLLNLYVLLATSQNGPSLLMV